MKTTIHQTIKPSQSCINKSVCLPSFCSLCHSLYLCPTLSLSHSARGHKRKLDEAQEEERGEEEEHSKEAQGGASGSSNKQADEPVDHNADNEEDEEEEGSSSEADEMAAALDLELNDFM